MPFVLDASIVAYWALSGEDHAIADLAASRIRTDEALTPALLWFEVRNLLIVAERRKQIAEADAKRFLLDLGNLPIRADRSPQEDAVLGLARSRRLSVYDAAYLELAQREGVPLATLDRDLARAARAEGVAILGD